MRKFTGALALLLAFTPLAMADSGADLNKEILLCMYKAALQLDDGVSDVASIAPAIVDSCKRESMRLDQHIRSQVNGPVDEVVIAAAWRKFELDKARMVLLAKRAEDRKTK
jgi:hypothetical protein